MSERTHAGFAMRTPFERRYVKDLAASAHPDAVRAFNATPPVRRKYFAGARGMYRPEHHYVVAPPRWECTAEGKVWLGVFAHEIGHAIDMHGRGVAKARSIALAPAIRRDRARLGARIAAERRLPKRQRGCGGAGGLCRFPAGARAVLLRTLPHAMAAATFARTWHDGAPREALRDLAERMTPIEVAGQDPRRSRQARETARLMAYALATVGDFIGAVYDLEGGGRSRGYYNRFPAVSGPSLTVGHTAEAFANAFVSDVLEGRELLSYLTRTAAPSTHAAYRNLLAGIGRAGPEGGKLSRDSSSR